MSAVLSVEFVWSTKLKRPIWQDSSICILQAIIFVYENDRIIAYIARNAHGIYPYEGSYIRFYGLANDITNKGIQWDPEIKISQDFANYGNEFTNENVNNVAPPIHTKTIYFQLLTYFVVFMLFYD